MGMDRFGNQHAPDLSYARGAILASTADDFRKLQHAWGLIRERGPERSFHLYGARAHAPHATGVTCCLPTTRSAPHSTLIVSRSWRSSTSAVRPTSTTSPPSTD